MPVDSESFGASPHTPAPDVHTVRALVSLCQRAGVHDLEASEGDWYIRLHLDLEAAGTLPDQTETPDIAGETSSTVVVNSDWVGVFRRALDTETQPIVLEGQQVAEGDVIALIEAMQLLHEQRAHRAGKVSRFLVEDGSAVEYGQPLLELA